MHDHGPATTIHFQAVICVINRLLSGHCFLEHRCHDIIRKANSTFLSADRSPRQLSKAKKSGSKILKKAYLRVFGRVQYIRKTISTVFPLRNGVFIPPEVAWNTRHATRNTQHAIARLSTLARMVWHTSRETSEVFRKALENVYKLVFFHTHTRFIIGLGKKNVYLPFWPYDPRMATRVAASER